MFTTSTNEDVQFIQKINTRTWWNAQFSGVVDATHGLRKHHKQMFNQIHILTRKKQRLIVNRCF